MLEPSQLQNPLLLLSFILAAHSVFVAACLLMLFFIRKGFSFWPVPSENKPELELTAATADNPLSNHSGLSDDELHQLEMDIFWLAFQHNDRWCSVRGLFDAANQHYNPFYDRQISHSRIQAAVKKYAWSNETGGPFITYNANGRLYFFCLLECEADTGGLTRRLISVKEMHEAWFGNEMYTKRVQKWIGHPLFAAPDPPENVMEQNEGVSIGEEIEGETGEGVINEDELDTPQLTPSLEGVS